MLIPKIAVKLSKSFCLYDFLERLKGAPFSPFELERKLYQRKLRRVINDFSKISFKNENPAQLLKYNLTQFNNTIFEKLWFKYKKDLKRQGIQINNILKGNGEKILKKILKITKIKRYPYSRILIFLTFPRLLNIKPEVVESTGTAIICGSTCIVPLGLLPSMVLKNHKDLYVLWHEIIHSLQASITEARIIREVTAITYEGILAENSKERRKKRLEGYLRTEEISTSLKNKLMKINLNWRCNKDIFELENSIARELRRGK